jgi:hypothetical protein
MPDDNALLSAATTPQTDSTVGVEPMSFDAAKYTDPFSKQMANLETFAMDQPLYRESVTRKKGLEKQFNTAATDMKELYKNPPEQPDYEKFKQTQNIPVLKDESEYAQKATPYYCLMAVFGGVLGKNNARVALNAQASCLEALNTGNHGRYLVAKQAHDDAISNMDREWKNYMEAYKVGEKIFEGKVNAAQLSMDLANRAIGVEDKNEVQLIGQIQKAYASFSALQEKRQKDEWTRELRADANRVGAFRAGTNAAKFWFDKNTKFTSQLGGLERLQSGLQDVQKAWDDMKGSASLKNMQYAKIAPNIIDTWLTTKDPKYALLAQKMADLADSALRFQSEGLSSGAQRIKAVEIMSIKGLPNLEGKTPEQVTEAIRSLLQKTQESIQMVTKQQEYATEKEEQMSMGGMMSGGAPEPAPATTPAPAGATGAAPAKKTATSKDVTDYYNKHKASFPNGEAQARAYLESNGYEVK